MTLPEILSLLKQEKNSRDTESRRLYVEARQGVKHDARTVATISQLLQEEKVLSQLIHTLTTMPWNSPAFGARYV